MAKLLYNAGIRTYNFGIRLASLFNEKAKDWREGRKDWAPRLTEACSHLDRNKKTVWFHVSSLGEFEQGRPVMETLKKEGHNLILSFYSPSGYKSMQNWELADFVTYLPIDNQKNAKKFIEIVRPDLAVFVKYDLWFNYLNELKKRNIPSLLISARFYSEQIYFKAWARWAKKLLFLLDCILVQDTVSQNLLESIDYKNVELTGDTRYDRVAELSMNNDHFPEIEGFIGSKKVFIAGSSWPLDEEVIIPYMHNSMHDIKYIIAPHDVGKEHINSLINKCGDMAITYSRIQELTEEKILIIDGIGMLSRLYKYAAISYIGGAFKEGLHNILEPAAYGLPVITGPDHKGFLEGPEMEAAGALFRIKDANDFATIMDRLLENEQAWMKASHAAKAFISDNRGASKKTRKVIEEYLN